MTTTTHYQTLGVPCAASAREITKAYKTRAFVSHPDRVPPARRQDATVEFQKLAEAYACLRDEHARKVYDAQIAMKSSTASRPQTRSDAANMTDPQTSAWMPPSRQEKPLSGFFDGPSPSAPKSEAYFCPPFDSWYQQHRSSCRGRSSQNSSRTFRYPLYSAQRGASFGSQPSWFSVPDTSMLAFEAELRKADALEREQIDLELGDLSWLRCSTLMHRHSRRPKPLGRRQNHMKEKSNPSVTRPDSPTEFKAGYAAGYAAAMKAAQAEDIRQTCDIVPPTSVSHCKPSIQRTATYGYNVPTFRYSGVSPDPNFHLSSSSFGLLSDQRIRKAKSCERGLFSEPLKENMAPRGPDGVRMADISQRKEPLNNMKSFGFVTSQQAANNGALVKECLIRRAMKKAGAHGEEPLMKQRRVTIIKGKWARLRAPSRTLSAPQ